MVLRGVQSSRGLQSAEGLSKLSAAGDGECRVSEKEGRMTKPFYIDSYSSANPGHWEVLDEPDVHGNVAYWVTTMSAVYPTRSIRMNSDGVILGTEEVRVVDAVTGGAKGQKGCQLGAVDPLALIEVGKIAGFGGEKYERYNFAKGYKWSLSYDALQRHLMAFWAGENIDPESKLPHVAHAAWHCLALLTFSLRNKGTDDRFPH